MTASLRIAVIASIAALCAGAVYLMFTRGPAMLLDLSAAMAGMLCL